MEWDIKPQLNQSIQHNRYTSCHLYMTIKLLKETIKLHLVSQKNAFDLDNDVHYFLCFSFVLMLVGRVASNLSRVFSGNPCVLLTGTTRQLLDS